MKFFLDTFWVIAAIPLLTSVVIATFARSIRGKAWIIGAGGMGIAAIWSLMVLFAAISGMGDAGHAHAHTDELLFYAEPLKHIVWHNWAPFGPFSIDMGLMVDNLTAFMLVVVTVVSFCVQVYSSEYLHNDKRFTRFYAAINLFTMGMLGLVLADNLFLLLVCWEIMGLCSYLLIGHWYELEWPRMGQIKAFLTTRVGDVGMIVGILIIFMLTKTFTWHGLAETIPTLVQDPVTAGLLALGAILLFTGAMGKSAQFPLHTWLPDAMAGPTPGSALIHAATMVAAGVYLVGRSFMVYGAVPGWVLVTVAFIGAFTSLFAASIATLRWDIKEVLAFSTISQLGYMIMGLGLGGWTAGNFHLITHAFFKALLFLAAGSVIHAHHHNQELHRMGGLRHKIPVTFAVWMIGYLALAGFPGFSGFFSKDELLVAAWTWHGPAGVHLHPFVEKLPFIMALMTAFLTAYYMTRATYLAFFGKPRDMKLYEQAHESPKRMTIPMIILAVPAALIGWFGAPVPYYTLKNYAGVTASWMKGLINMLSLPGAGHEVTYATEVLVTAIATTTGTAGIVTGLVLYKYVKPETRAGWIAAGRPVYNLVRNKYFVDELYNAAFIRTSMALSKGISWFDGAVVDGIVNNVGKLGTSVAYATGWVDANIVDRLVTMWAGIARSFASTFRRISTGYVQQYMLTFVVVVVVSVLLFQVIS